MDSEPGRFEYQINRLLIKGNFAQIDKIARETRARKKRFANGKWALFRLYEGLTTIYETETIKLETESAWKERIELLKAWKQKFPDSATARIALAGTYIGYGWFARGIGFANTVSKENADLLSERLTMAENELFEAKDLKEKCTQWYFEKLTLAMATSASSEEFEDLFNEAIDFEPNYYSYYSIKSENLKPKWGGSQEEWQAFIDSIPQILAQHNSDEGNIMYLLIVTAEMKDPIIRDYSVFSKATIRRGFAEVSKRYGIDDVLLNSYAFFSVLILDPEAAKEAMDKIQDKPNPQVWSKQTYYGIRKQLESGVFSTDDSKNSF